MCLCAPANISEIIVHLKKLIYSLPTKSGSTVNLGRGTEVEERTIWDALIACSHFEWIVQLSNNFILCNQLYVSTKRTQMRS